MAQRSDHIRQDIESTRASLDSKLDTLEAKARQTLDVKQQVAERPWMALGAAVAAGYVLGNLGRSEYEQRWHGQPAVTTDYNQHAYTVDPQLHYPRENGGSSRPSGDRFLAQFDNEIDMLKSAAVTMLTNVLHDVIKEYVPALGQQIESMEPPGKTRSTAARVAHDDDNRPRNTAPQSDAEQETFNELLTRAPSTATQVESERSIGIGRTR